MISTCLNNLTNKKRWFNFWFRNGAIEFRIFCTHCEYFWGRIIYCKIIATACIIIDNNSTVKTEKFWRIIKIYRSVSSTINSTSVFMVQIMLGRATLDIDSPGACVGNVSDFWNLLLGMKRCGNIFFLRNSFFLAGIAVYTKKLKFFWVE